MKRIYLFLLIHLTALTAFGQTGYYLTDSATSQGVMLVDAKREVNANFCQVKIKEDVVVFTPYQVIEYGFNESGRVYESYEVVYNSVPARFFLERIVTGKINLYYLNSHGNIRFYIKNNKSTNLEEIPQNEKDCRTFLEKYVRDSPGAIGDLTHLKYNEYSLVQFLTNYLNGQNRPLPRFHFGFRLGLDATQFSPVYNLSTFTEIDFETYRNLSAGVYMDLPIKSSPFSIAPELNYKENHFVKAFFVNKLEYDLIMNYSSLNIPVFLRYSFLNKKCSPYIQAGPLYSRTIRNATRLLEYNESENDVAIVIKNAPVLSNNMGGFTLGSGIISNYGKKISLFGEVRYSQLYNLDKSSKNLTMSEFSLLLGFLF